MHKNFQHVCSAIKIRNVEIPNRIFYPPMGTNLAEADGSAGERLIRYYEARAKGGVGLICMEGAAVTHIAGTGVVAELSLEDGRFIPGLKDLTDAVHSYGSKISIQIHHPGRQALQIANRGAIPVAPSPIPCPVVSQIDQGVVPRELTVQEIELLEDQFAQAASRAQLAGFDAVELHGSHGYLLTQFLSPLTNHREDVYGGSFEKRMRFPLQIVNKIKRLAPSLPIIIRLSAEEGVEGGITLDLTKRIAMELEKAGVDAISVSCGFYPTMEKVLPPIYFSRGWLIDMAAEIKKAVNIPVLGVSRIPSLGLAEEILSESKVDMVGMGRALIADPDLVKKSISGKQQDIRPCIYCNYCALDRILSFCRLRCAVNYDAGREYLPKTEKAEISKRVFVVGGGPAGMEMARKCALKGHSVKLAEADSELGGQLRAAAGPSFKKEVRDYLAYLEGQIRNVGVEVQMGLAVNAEDILQWSPDVVVLATGATPLIPDIPGISKAVTAIDVLKSKVNTAGQVVVAGAGYVGCETALHLAEQGKTVTLIEMNAEVAMDAAIIEKTVLEKKLKEKRINVITGQKMIEVVDNGIITQNVSGNNQHHEAASVVLALGQGSRQELSEALKGKIPQLYQIGDCAAPGRVYNATTNAGFVADCI